MAFNYIVTASRASAVNHCLTGNFSGPDDMNLITAKQSKIEISKITPEGLQPMLEVGVYGNIDTLKLFRMPGSNKDLLFMLTTKYHVAILEAVEGSQPDTIDIVTRRSGNVADPASRQAETGNIVIIDPASKMIALRLYDGLLKIIPLDNKNNKYQELEAFNIRMEETTVPSITFLYGFQNPTIGFIYKDRTGTSHVKTYEVSLKEKEFILGPWDKGNVANEASIIIPVPQPFGGAIIIALESIVYINGANEKVIAPPLIAQSPINCYAPIDKDGSRYLLGDLTGRLFCLILKASDYRPSDSKLEVQELKLELLGEISIPECITYLDNAVVYVGSKLGDSQLIKLLTRPDENGSCIQVCETFTNLGPIVDMCLVDLEKQGQGQLVTCSGHSKDGSLRIIRNGIGINEHSSMDLPGIKGVWSLKIGHGQLKDNYILLTFIEESFLWFCENEGDFDNNVEEDGFDRSKRTVHCSNVASNQIIQVTRESIRLISSLDKRLVEVWTLPSKNGIYKVSNNSKSVVCADGKKLYFFEIQPGKLTLVQEKELEAEIACFDISPLNFPRSLLSVGFWFNNNIVIYGLPELTDLFRETLNSDIVPRSIITARLEDNYYLLCALGDGSVYYFNLNPKSGALSNNKKVTLGTYETILRPFKSQSTTSIFACSDRPTVIYSSNNKLVFSNVNLKEVNFMCSIDTNFYSDSLALVSDSDILFGTIDEIQKLHIRTIPLKESPVKIAHQQSTQTFGLITLREDYRDPEKPGLKPVRQSASTQAHSRSNAVSMSTSSTKPTGILFSDTTETETSNLLIINQHTFEVLHAHQFMPTENVVSILSAPLGEDNREEYFIVGTAFVNLDEPEPKQGRLIVYKWTQDSNLQQVSELSIKGCPYALCEFDGKFIAGVNATVNLVELNSRRDLHIECSYANAIMALFIKRKGPLLLIGDFMRSMSLFSYKSLQAHFEEVARDLVPAWMTEVEILDDNTFLGAEHKGNIFISQRDAKASEQDRQQMHQVASFHVGDFINVFHPGSLVVQHPSESSVDVKRTTLFGTVGGIVGLILGIDETLFRKLEAVQNYLSKIIKSVGRIEHSEWRAFLGEKSSSPAQGFIDGDLVETFLDLSRDKMEQVANQVNVPVEELVKMVEELSRLH